MTGVAARRRATGRERDNAVGAEGAAAAPDGAAAAAAAPDRARRGGSTGQADRRTARPLLVPTAADAPSSAHTDRPCDRAPTGVTRASPRTSGPFVRTYPTSGPLVGRRRLGGPGWAGPGHGTGPPPSGIGHGRRRAGGRGGRGRSAREQLEVTGLGQPGRHALAGRGRAGAGDEAGVGQAARRRAGRSSSGRRRTGRARSCTSSSAVPPATARRMARSRWVRFAVIGPVPSSRSGSRSAPAAATPAGNRNQWRLRHCTLTCSTGPSVLGEREAVHDLGGRGTLRAHHQVQLVCGYRSCRPPPARIVGRPARWSRSS